jgi:hypothetical protein
MFVYDMFHGMFAYWSGLGQDQGNKNETLTPGMFMFQK